MTDVAATLSVPLAQSLLDAQPLLHLSYSARDGGPRVIPVAYQWDGAAFRMWTIPGSAKTRALQQDARVALSIDILGPPPRLLLARGRAELATIDGVPSGYLDASHRTMPRDAWDDFDAGVRALYSGMTAITVTPDWAKFIDFETNVPSAVEALARQRA